MYIPTDCQYKASSFCDKGRTFKNLPSKLCVLAPSWQKKRSTIFQSAPPFPDYTTYFPKQGIFFMK